MLFVVCVVVDCEKKRLMEKGRNQRTLRKQKKGIEITFVSVEKPSSGNKRLERAMIEHEHETLRE